MCFVFILLYLGVGALVARSVHDPEDRPEDIPPWVYWAGLVIDWPVWLYLTIKNGEDK